jgi:ribosomal protein L11 methyltransferase
MNKSDKWFSIFVPCEQNAFESIHNFFFEAGASGTEECRNGIRGYFQDPPPPALRLPPLEAYVRSLESLGFSIGNPICDAIPNQDWGEAWRERFKPVRITNRILVKPPWESAGTSQIVIDIYPRMAFGTGTHETTQICLILLEHLITPPSAVLDLGTGSGILAIAAAKLGAKHILALDPDPDAVCNALENVRLNGVANRVSVKRGTIDSLLKNAEGFNPGVFDPHEKRFSAFSDSEKWNPERFDLVLANIDRSTLLNVIPDVMRLVNPNGVFVLSGILCMEKEIIEPVLRRHRWKILETLSKGEWTGMACRLENG